MKKYSKQRELLIENLKSRCDHPTAEQLYESLKGEISLPTVYRNLAQLADDGAVLRIRTNGPDRFDGFACDHPHFECICCNKVLDIQLPQNYGVGMVIDGCKIIGSKLTLYGYCPDCQASTVLQN